MSLRFSSKWLKYSTVTNGLTFYTESSQTFKKIKTNFYRKHCWLSFKIMKRNCIVVVNVLLPICCHIGSGMPNLRIFVKDIVTLLGAMTDKWA